MVKKVPNNNLATTINAFDIVVKMGDVLIGCLTSADFTVDSEMTDVSCTATGKWKGAQAGQLSWAGSVNGVYRRFTAAEQATNFGFKQAFALIISGAPVTVSYEMADGTGERYEGQALVSQVKFTRPEKDAVSWSFSLTGNGPLAEVV